MKILLLRIDLVIRGFEAGPPEEYNFGIVMFFVFTGAIALVPFVMGGMLIYEQLYTRGLSRRSTVLVYDVPVKLMVEFFYPPRRKQTPGMLKHTVDGKTIWMVITSTKTGGAALLTERPRDLEILRKSISTMDQEASVAEE